MLWAWFDLLAGPAAAVRARPLQLELISCLPEGPARPLPLLFIHGAYTAAWCWAEYFLPFFARHGYAAHAMSLRGHGGSEGQTTLYRTGLCDYVADVQQVIAELQQTPVLIGHSMGGMVVQKYLEKHTAPGVALLSSVPPQGLLFSGLRLALSDPWLFHEMNAIQFGSPRFATIQGAKRAIFAPAMPEWQVAKYYRRMQQESERAIMDMTWFDLPLPPVTLPPALVLGGEHDRLFRPEQVASTARAFGVQGEIMPDVAHAFMLEPGWQRVAERLLRWLAELDRLPS